MSDVRVDNLARAHIASAIKNLKSVLCSGLTHARAVSRSRRDVAELTRERWRVSVSLSRRLAGPERSAISFWACACKSRLGGGQHYPRTQRSTMPPWTARNQIRIAIPIPEATTWR